MFKKTLISTLLASVMFVSAAHAGPFILAGTDADDHGGANATENLTGWLFMQRALENLASSSALTNGHLNVVNLGSSSTGEAGRAAASAFGFLHWLVGVVGVLPILMVLRMSQTFCR